ncbi:beta-N-acetylhexosaminidase [Arthrobacter sp. ERGS1:01]|uniref:beta-N-acetylhexosaminidase n=1 Tax=Arthrobacter sp. ERGS1:01 TaxID=1704044 RepID=UPI000ACD9859|nr:beta-N-acetylhexosaminidase [Arthrobacter sp. ERGS1:01]
MNNRHRFGHKAVVAALTAAAMALASTAAALPGASAAPAPAVLAPAVVAVAAPSGTVPLTPAGAPQTIPGLSNWTPATGAFTLGAGARVVGADATLTGDLATQLGSVLGRTVATGTSAAVVGDIEIAVDPSRSAELGKEGYELKSGTTLKVTGATDAGAFYGAQTIVQLLTQGNVVNAGTSTDVPRYQERGVGLCACQVTISLESLERTMKDMAYNKLNQLWLETKLKSDAYPKANFWAYYTKAEAAQITAWAKKYHIQLVLEVNSPGHMRPWLYDYPELQLVNKDGVKKEEQLDITAPEAFTMVTKLADEYAAAFPGQPYWHMGGDEYMMGDSYANYPQFQAFVTAHPEIFPANSGPGDVFVWFMNKVNAYVKSKGKTLRIWNDGVPSSSKLALDKDIVVEHWLNSGPRPRPCSTPAMTWKTPRSRCTSTAPATTRCSCRACGPPAGPPASSTAAAPSRRRPARARSLARNSPPGPTTPPPPRNPRWRSSSLAPNGSWRRPPGVDPSRRPTTPDLPP